MSIHIDPYIRPWALCPQGVFIGALLVLWEGGLVCLEGPPPPALNWLACTAYPFFQSFFDMVLALTFHLILVPTWLQLASQLRSKIDQKSIQEPSKIYSNLYLVLSTFLNRFLIDFGSNLGTSNPPFTCKKQWFLKIFMILLDCLLDGF